MSFTPMKKKESPKAGCRVMPNAVVLRKKAKGIYFFSYLLMSLHGHDYSFCFFVFFPYRVI